MEKYKINISKKVLLNPGGTVDEIFTKARESWLAHECQDRCDDADTAVGVPDTVDGVRGKWIPKDDGGHIFVPDDDSGGGGTHLNFMVRGNLSAAGKSAAQNITPRRNARSDLADPALQSPEQRRVRVEEWNTPVCGRPNAPTVNKCVLEQWYYKLLLVIAMRADKSVFQALLYALSPEEKEEKEEKEVAAKKVFLATFMQNIHNRLDDKIAQRERLVQMRELDRGGAAAAAVAGAAADQRFRKTGVAIKKLDMLREGYTPLHRRPDTFAGGPEARQRKLTALLALRGSAGVRDAAQKMYNPPPPPRLDAVERRRSFGSWLPPPTPLALFKDAPTPANAAFLLGVQPNASKKEIKKAYKKCSLQNHPDKGGSNSAQWEQCVSPRDILLPPKSERKGGHRVRIEKRKRTRRRKKNKRKRTRRRKKNKRKRTRRRKKNKRKKTRRGNINI